jgi:glycosyltransferase involved in cell wall biosynthesis
MAIQARKLIALLEEADFEVNGVRTNSHFPDSLTWVTRVPGLRTLVNHVLFMRTLHKALKKSDVVYFLSGFVSFFWWVTYPALILIKLSGKPVILSARGGDARRFFNRWGKLVAPILRRIDVITTPSGFLQKAFEDAFDIKPVIVPNIADLDQFTFRQRDFLRPRLIVTRSLDEIYNVACVIRAFALVHVRFGEATLAVVGDGTQRQMLENLVNELGLKGAVTFYGRVDHAQIQVLYNDNDIAVNASNIDNLPGTVLEAYACGLPIVSTRAGGIPYMVEDGVTGLLIDLDDDEALAARVLDLLEQPQLAQDLIANGRKEAEKYSEIQVRNVLIPLLMRVGA